MGILPDWMMDFRPEGVRPCRVESNQFGEYGWFHKLYSTNENGGGERVWALVETSNGQLNRYDISECYSIQFLVDVE